MKELYLTVPEGWHQVTEKQLEYVARLLYHKMPEPEFLSRCFMRFSGLSLLQRSPVIIDEIPHYCFTHNKKRHYIDVDTFTDLTHKLDWILRDVGLFKNPAKIGSYIGCNYKLYGVSFEEFLIADQMYIAYSSTSKEEFINKLIAICYRKPNETWDEGKQLAIRTIRFENIPMRQKYMIYLWFTGLKAWIIGKYPYVFSSSGKGIPVSPNEAVLSTLAALNGGDITKNPEIKRTEAHEALDMLNRKCELATQ
jgi:hypothetical protein